MDVVEVAVKGAKETRVARGKVDDMYVLVVVSPFRRRKMSGYEIIVLAEKGTRSNKVRYEFFDREEAYREFECVVNKYSLKEVNE